MPTRAGRKSLRIQAALEPNSANTVCVAAGWTYPSDLLFLSFRLPCWIPGLYLKRGVCISSSVHFSSLFIFSARKR